MLGLRLENMRRFFLRLLVFDQIHNASGLFLHVITQ